LDAARPHPHIDVPRVQPPALVCGELELPEEQALELLPIDAELRAAAYAGPWPDDAHGDTSGRRFPRRGTDTGR
jgi:hypothetical protein